MGGVVGTARDLDVDVVVVGFGGAGAAAAITVHDLGGTVAIVEKQPAAAHTPSTRLSGGAVMAVNDVEAAAAYLQACAGKMIPPAVSRAWAGRALGLPQWLEDIGLPVRRARGAEHPEFRGADGVDVYVPAPTTDRNDPDPSFYAGGAGRTLFASLRKAVERRAIPCLWEAPARRLLQDDRGVAGVELGGAGEVRRVRAARAVVLACGGFEHDEDLKLNFLRGYPTHFYANPANTGDGIRLAQAAGASLWHMNQMVGRAIASFPEGDGKRVNVTVSLAPPGYVITDRYGERFADESAQARMRHDFYYHLITYDGQRGEYPRIPCFWFFDERRRRAGPLTNRQIGLIGVGQQTWSDDNLAEIDRGWIVRGATVEETAERAGVEDPLAAGRTVARYNDACPGAQDPEFGRMPETLVPLDEPPFYCVPLWPGGSHTSGGPRRNEHAQVLDVDGDPIRGLYAAGELGQAIGMLYPADGSSISDALCFGRIAGAHAMGPLDVSRAGGGA